MEPQINGDNVYGSDTSSLFSDDYVLETYCLIQSAQNPKNTLLRTPKNEPHKPL
jgi:hypothetical protein